MDHVEKTIKKFHNRLAKKQRKCAMWWGHQLLFSGGGNCTNVPHQVATQIKAKNFQKITLWT
jgi:hypothetical protein